MTKTGVKDNVWALLSRVHWDGVRKYYARETNWCTQQEFVVQYYEDECWFREKGGYYGPR